MNLFIKKYSTHHSSRRGYLTGFIASIILTLIPFWIVMKEVYPKNIIVNTIVICAIIQVLVHLIYFLHLNRNSEGGWNMVSFVFALIVIVILIMGSLWIMWNLNYNMMEHDDMIMDFNKMMNSNHKIMDSTMND